MVIGPIKVVLPCITNIYLSFAANQVGSCDELNGIPQRCFHAYSSQHSESVITHIHILFFTSIIQQKWFDYQKINSNKYWCPLILHLQKILSEDKKKVFWQNVIKPTRIKVKEKKCLPDFENLFDLFLFIRWCWHNQQAVKQINRDTMWTHVLCASDSWYAKSKKLNVHTSERCLHFAFNLQGMMGTHASWSVECPRIIHGSDFSPAWLPVNPDCTKSEVL